MSSKEPKVPEDDASDTQSTTSTTSSVSTGLSVEGLRQYLADKLGLSDDDDSQEKVKVLDDVSIDGIVDYIRSHKCKTIITLAGAGISTSAGIPDFRSPGSGLYHNLQKYKLPHPQAIFELDFFHENPQPFFELAKELYPGTFKPTVCHYFIKLLNNKGYLLRHYTQNIDTLERVAGIPDEKLVEAHGTFHKGHCMKCHKEYTQEWMKEEIFANRVPTCVKCPGVVKPDIVFFGESLPDKFHECMLKDFKTCDLLIILGSSLAVQPFASLVDRIRDNCPRLLINREKAGQRSGIMALMGVTGGFDFESKDNTRDVLWLGNCDDGCRLLAEKLGWGEELQTLYDNATKKIDDPGDVSKEGNAKEEVETKKGSPKSSPKLKDKKEKNHL